MRIDQLTSAVGDDAQIGHELQSVLYIVKLAELEHDAKIQAEHAIRAGSPLIVAGKEYPQDFQMLWPHLVVRDRRRLLWQPDDVERLGLFL